MSSPGNIYKYCRIYKCTICSFDYNVKYRNGFASGKIPLLLPCGHSVCEECILRLTKTDGINCKSCFFQVKVDSISENIRDIFPINRYVFSMLVEDKEEKRIDFPTQSYLPGGSLYRKKLASPEEKRLCSQSPPCKNVADLRCDECEEIFCKTCDTQIHSKIRKMQTHLRLPMAIANVADFSLKCKEHPDSVCEYFCNTCDVMICSICLIKTHKADDFISLIEKNELDIPILTAYKSKANKIINVLENSHKEVLAQFSNIQCTVKDRKVEFQIKEYFADLHGSLQIRELQLLDELKKYENTDVQTLSEIAGELEAKIKKCNAIVAAGELVEKKEHLNKMNVSEVIRQINEVINTPCHLIENQKAKMSVEFIKENNSVEKLDQFGKLKFSEYKRYKLLPIVVDEMNIGNFPGEDGDKNKNESNVEPQTSIPEVCSEIRDYTYSESTYNKARVSLTGIPPDVRNIPTEKEYSIVSNINVGSVEAVIVTHIKDLFEFYIQLKRDKQQVEKVGESYKKQAKTTKTPKLLQIGSVYIVQYNTENNCNWYRAVLNKKVVMGNEDFYDVTYIDYGNNGRVSASMIKTITLEQSKLGPFAHKCCIAGIKIIPETSNDAILCMVKFIHSSSCLQMRVINKQENTLEVDLISDHESLQKALSYAGYVDITLPASKSDSPSPLVTQQVKIASGMSNFRKEEEYVINVSHVESPHCLYVQLVDNKHLICNMEKTMGGYLRNSKKLIFAPEKGMYCAAYMTHFSKWVRSEIIGLPGFGMVEVFSLDYGVSEVLPLKKIKKLPNNFRQVDSQATKVSLLDIAPTDPTTSEWSPIATRFLMDTVKNKYLKMKIISCQPDHFEVIIFGILPHVDICINGLMVRQGMAISTGDSSLLVEIFKTLPDNAENQGKSPSEKDFDTNSTDDVEEEMKNLLTGPYYKPVEILLIESPSLFYATLPEWKFLRKRFCKTLSKFYSGKEPDDVKWTLNSLCVVRSLVDNEFYRAIITDIPSDDTYTVFLKDIVRKETVPAKNLYKLEENFSTHFELSIRCSLTGIKPAGDQKTWSHSAIDYFKHLVRKYHSLQMTRMGEIVDKIIPVKLISSTQVENGPLELPTERRVCLNKLMITKGLAFFDNVTQVDEKSTNIKELINSPLHSDGEQNNSSDEEQNSVMETWMPAPRFENKQFKAWVTYVDHSGHVYLQTETARNRLNEMIRTYNKHFMATCPEAPRNWKPGQMVSVQYHLDKNFCRGTVIDIVPGGNIMVKLVDFGNEEEVSHEELRSEVLYTNVPILCNEVSLVNVVPRTDNQKWSVAALDTLHYLIVDKEFEVTVVSESSKTKIPSVILKRGDMIINNEVNNFKWSKVTGSKTIDDKSSDLDDDSVVVEGEVEENMSSMEKEFTEWKGKGPLPKRAELLVPSYKQIELDTTQHQFEAAVVSILDYNDITIETEFFEKLTKETAKEFQNLMQEIQKHAVNQPVVKKFQKGYPCVAPYTQDNFWYRAEIFDKETTENSMQVLFVDYGNVEAVPIEDIRETRESWLDFPVQILRCKLVNVELGKNADPEEVCKALAEAFDQKMLVKVKSFKPKLEIYLYKASTGTLAFQDLLDNGSLRMTEP